MIQKTVLLKTKTFTLTKCVEKRRDVKKKYYVVTYTRYTSSPDQWVLYDHFDPFDNRGLSVFSTEWKFNDRKEAEQLITLAILKWPELC